MYYLIGKTLSHSHSPTIHRAFGQYDYDLLPLDEDALASFVQSDRYEGLNVTVPYKQAIIPCLDELSETARRTGAVNTVVRRDGKLFGDNTDYLGFFAMAYRKGISFKDKKVVILGSGGTSHTVEALVRDLGAKETVVISRTGENNYGNISLHSDADILVNTTPVGMYPNNGAAPLSLKSFPRLSGVLDVIYNPLRTALLQEAEERGIPHANGLYMLVAQAAVSCGLFGGNKPDQKEIDRVHRLLHKKVSNITLVGMPGAGKSTVACLIAEKTGRTVVDTDKMIEEMFGKSPAIIIREEGEAAFRQKEHEAIVAAGKLSGVVISTGGGAVLTPENKAPLAQNGPIVLLVRELARLSTENRPLSDGADLTAMYRQRLPRYLSFAERSYDNNRTPAECADDIIADYL